MGPLKQLQKQQQIKEQARKMESKQTPFEQQQHRIEALEKQVQYLTDVITQFVSKPQQDKPQASFTAAILVQQGQAALSQYGQPIVDYLNRTFAEKGWRFVLEPLYDSEKGRAILQKKNYQLGLVLSWMPSTRPSVGNPSDEALIKRLQTHIPNCVWLHIEQTASNLAGIFIRAPFGGGIFLGTPEAMATSLHILVSKGEVWKETDDPTWIHNKENCQLLGQMIQKIIDFS